MARFKLCRMLSVTLFAACAGSPVLTASADDRPFVRPMQAASSQSCNYAFPAKIPVRCWVGQKIIILPPMAALRGLAYSTIHLASDQYTFPMSDEIAGKTATVTSVEIADSPVHAGSQNPHNEVTFVFDGKNKKKYAAQIEFLSDYADDGYVEHVALLRDLQQARSNYVGKSLWVDVSGFPSLASAGGASHVTFVNFPKFSKLTISDVLVGEDSDAPVRFIVKNGKGEEGYSDIPLSRTNRSSNDDVASLFQRIFSTRDPRLVHRWPARVWAALAADQIFVGMTADQVRMCWFEPRHIDRSQNGGHRHEVWTFYDGRMLSLDDNVLTAILK